MIAIVILAAGASSRMRGRDKLLEAVDGVPLLRAQVLRASATGAPVYVTLPPPPHARYDLLKDTDATPVTVQDARDGMNASLSAGIATLPDTTQAAMIVLGDMPEITTSDMKSMLQAIDLKSDTRIWRATSADGANGHPVVFRADLFAELTALRGDEGGRKVTKRFAEQTRLVPLPAQHAITDLDTPEDWAKWRGGSS